MNFLSTPKKDPMTPKARCKAWTTQTQNRKGGGEKKSPREGERERERERESATTPLNLLTSSRESLKKKSFYFYKNRNYTKLFPPCLVFSFELFFEQS
jgi:transposase-like protein